MEEEESVEEVEEGEGDLAFCFRLVTVEEGSDVLSGIKNILDEDAPCDCGVAGMVGDTDSGRVEVRRGDSWVV